MDTQDKWLEISMQVNGELAEAVAEVLSRFIPTGVVVEQLVPSGHQGTDTERRDQMRVAGYLPVDDKVEELRQGITEALWYLGRIRELPEPVFESVQQTDWSEAWKKNYHPIPVGQKLLIAPSWVEPDPQGRTVIRIDPGMAFGTGTHPTTKLSLEFLETEVLPQQTMIDIGCGSGILAIAALKLGASFALGADPDTDAIEAARVNAKINGVAQDCKIIQGSVSELQALDQAYQTAPLVVANILAPVLIKLLKAGMADLVASNGALVLSGILQEQAQSLYDEAGHHGLHFVARKQEGDWVAMLFKKQ